MENKKYIILPDNVKISDISDGYHTFRELYNFRKIYNAVLFNEWAKQGLYQVHKSLRHYNGEECFGGDYFIVVAILPSGQITNHYKIPNNLNVLLSMWPYMKNPKRTLICRTWIRGDLRVPNDVFKCKGQCQDCYQCWNRKTKDILLKGH